MLAPQVLLLAFAVAITSACSGRQEARAETYCKLEILESLPRPETADFFDFFEITKQEYGDLLTGMMIDSLTPRRPAELEYVRAMIESAIRTTSRDVADRMARRGALFYRYRVSSRDRLDQPLTPIQICLANGDQCSCVSRETFTEARAAPRPR